LANLAGSTFEGNDGNKVVDTTGNTDWANVAGLNTGTDKPSGSTDNAFGQGTKEDSAATSVVTGSIPPQKNDLTKFYEASELATNGHIYLYLGWERAVNIGAANLDFEINQNATAGFTAASIGPVLLNRTAGDLLVTFDFGGSGAPVLGLLIWTTTGATSQCFSANSLPCWGQRVNLTAASEAEGAVSADGLFGEAAIDLTLANVFPPGVCAAFGSTFVKSRSSSSFPAEVKDFIAPVDVNISNCGSITIHKVTENGDSTFGYTTTGGLSPATFDLTNGGQQVYSTVNAGSYSVTENLTGAQVTAGWTLKSLTCTKTGATTSYIVNGSTVSITEGFGGTVDCIYTNLKRAQPTVSTAQNLIPNDTFTLSGATSGAGGTITFNLYSPSDSTCANAPALTQTVNVSGNGSYVTTNTSFIASAVGTWRWASTYSGDINNLPATSSCGTERFTIINS